MTTAPRRKDAARNRERIVAVARGVLDEGTQLQLNDIARRLGVGVGTVYRHFPTAEALLETVAAPGLEALAAHGEAALSDEDAARALTGFLARTVEAQVTDISLSAVTAAPADALPRTTELRQTLSAVGRQLFQRASDAGAVRADVTPEDLVPLMCGVAYAATVHAAPAARASTARRYLAALLEGVLVDPVAR
ncbi:TetR/AcrR family transcriptional regulator [Kitasatospora sp. NPDC089913]|uniref:TetR/AcrR family transcriptional regulator n=1 Tax=Kitasatospora sp. NPDC089913 TaxID=3364080 RepID=UPI00380529C3